MTVHYGYENLVLSNPVVTSGIFDGVHRGHRFVLEALRKRARETDGESVVITFDPHPRQVLAHSQKPIFLLNSFEEKIELIEKTGTDHLIIVNFDTSLSMMEPAQFIEKIVWGKIGARRLIVGFNHHFGRRAAGNFETVKETAKKYGMSCEILDPVMTGEYSVSSSAIREALVQGRLDEANQMLGYDYFMDGIVVEGKKIGRKLGFPTANIKPCFQLKLIPSNGVYAVEVRLNNMSYPGVMSIGFNPTVNKNSDTKTIEVNMPGFKNDIYGEKVRIVFRFRLRDEMVFRNTAELARQIEKDRDEAMKMLGKY